MFILERPVSFLEMAVHLAEAGNAFDGVLFCAVSPEMSWMRSGTELSQLLKISYLLNTLNSCLQFCNQIELILRHNPGCCTQCSSCIFDS